MHNSPPESKEITPKDEELFRLMVDSVRDYSIFATDTTGRIVSWNSGAERLFGYSKAEVLGQSASILFTPEDRERGEPDRELQQAASAGCSEAERWHVRRDGSLFWTSDVVTPLLDDGGVRGFVKVARELTERNRAAEALSHLAAIVESSDDAIISKSLEGIILSWNKGAERIFGYSAEEVIGKSILILIPPDRVDEEPAILEKLKRGERIDHYETVRVTKDGRKVDISLTISPIRDNSGAVIAASKIAHDITEQKHAEEERDRLLKAEREARGELETIHNIGQLLAAKLDLHQLVQAVTDACTELVGARFGSFFYNVLDMSGAWYMLYTLSGVPREHFEDFPMPRATDLFGPTFRGEGTILIEDVKRDPRYGKNSPYYGMPPGHLPVTSYLAVPVVSRSGEVLGGLFFGHPDEAVFAERDARLVEGLAAQTAVAMDNARLFEAAQVERSKAELAASEKERLYREADEANRLKDEFLASVSHELRTPLNAILGWASMLRRGRLDQEGVTRAFETIERNARSQAQIIEDILDVSRVITGKLRLEVRPVDPASFIEAAIETLRPAAEAKNIRIQKIMDSGVATVSGDPSRLQQIVWNLLSNAIKFTPKGGRVQVRLERINSHIEINVSDTGGGISAEFLPFVFDRFRQADSSSTRQQGGLGLGLSIVRHLAELHGGTVMAASEGEGKGATFTVRLPTMIIHHHNPEEVRTHPRAGADLLPDITHRLDGLKILAVDDEADTLELLKAVLGECGAEVMAADSVKEALNLIEEFMPDVIVADIGMPGEDGYDFIGKVRDLPPERGGRVPAIALTAYARVEDRLRVLGAGFQMHVPKPVEPAELTAVIASLAAWGKR